MGPCAVIAYAGWTLRVELSTGAAFDAAGREVLRPVGGGDGGWGVLDRTPVSVRLGAGGDVVGGAVCRFEVRETGVVAEIRGGAWVGRAETLVELTTEVQRGDIPVQDRT